jgi:16S rRNA (cytosine1402-N4)-methyltransferase
LPSADSTAMPPLPSPTDTPASAARANETAGHETVLLREAVAALNLREGMTYVDATFGGGGHTTLILAHRPPVEMVIAIDADLAARQRVETLQATMPDGERLKFIQGNFRDLGPLLEDAGVEQVAGILFDLGVSSFQFDEGERGFSFRFDAPLDMRFDQSTGVTAADIVNTWEQPELASLFWKLGEERMSRQIAAAIVRERSRAPIHTTAALASLVERAVGGRRGKGIHPATRSFQALRIAVNGELNALESALDAVPRCLVPGGRLAVISFHSLEDRIVKRFIEEQSRTCVCPPDQPVCTCDTTPTLRRIGKPVRPSEAEVAANPRSRSAILRVAERLDAAGQEVSVQGRSA